LDKDEASSFTKLLVERKFNTTYLEHASINRFEFCT